MTKPVTMDNRLLRRLWLRLIRIIRIRLLLRVGRG
jgi:hypothetical protein